VKLKYNYGLFVTVQWVEWLLHKTQIDVPANLDGWKDLYNIGDKIRVKATEFKEVEGIKRVVRGQK
jgi:ribosomal protein S1